MRSRSMTCWSEQMARRTAFEKLSQTAPAWHCWGSEMP